MLTLLSAYNNLLRMAVMLTVTITLSGLSVDILSSLKAAKSSTLQTLVIRTFPIRSSPGIFEKMFCKMI